MIPATTPAATVAATISSDCVATRLPGSSGSENRCREDGLTGRATSSSFRHSVTLSDGYLHQGIR